MANIPSDKIKQASTSIPYAANQGIDFILACSQGARGTHVIRLVSGGTPDSVAFADLGLIGMADTSYLVLVDGETVGRVTVDESSKTVDGFDILGGAAAEVLQVLVIGRFADMPADDF